MRRKAELTIILPNYNSEFYIKKTIKSIFSQTYQKWKLIIIDDNSNNNTKKILRKYKNNKKVKIFYLISNHGAAYCRNYALNNFSLKIGVEKYKFIYNEAINMVL